MATFKGQPAPSDRTPAFPAAPVVTWNTARPIPKGWLMGLCMALNTGLAAAALGHAVQTGNPLLAAVTPLFVWVGWPFFWQPLLYKRLERLCNGPNQRAAMDRQLCAFLAVHAQTIPHTTQRTMCYAVWRWTREGLAIDAVSFKGDWLDIEHHFPAPMLPLRPPYGIPNWLCVRWGVRHKGVLFLDWRTAHVQMAVLAELRRRGGAAGNPTPNALTQTPPQPPTGVAT
jgi:hypothetical protein